MQRTKLTNKFVITIFIVILIGIIAIIIYSKFFSPTYLSKKLSMDTENIEVIEVQDNQNGGDNIKIEQDKINDFVLWLNSVKIRYIKENYSKDEAKYVIYVFNKHESKMSTLRIYNDKSIYIKNSQYKIVGKELELDYIRQFIK